MAEVFPGANPFKVPRAIQNVGGVRQATISGAETWTAATSTIQVLDGGLAGRTITLPAVHPGLDGLQFHVYNAGSTNDIILSDGGTVVTIVPGDWAIVVTEGTDWILAANSGSPTTTNAAAQRTTLGLVIGTDVQAQDATLQSLAALGTAADKVAYTTGVDTWAEAALTFYGRELIGDENSIQGRATMGLGAYLCRPVITIGAEAGNAIAVTIQLKDVDGNNVAREQLIEVWFNCPDADVVFTAAPTGTLLGGGGARAYVTTDATGLAVLTLTDTTPNYAGTGGLIVTPMSNGTDALVGFPAFTTVTFA